MTPEQKQKYKDGIDSALALLMEFGTALDNPPRGRRSCCAYCDEVFDEVESGKCPPDLLEHAKTCANSPHAKEIKRLTADRDKWKKEAERLIAIMSRDGLVTRPTNNCDCGNPIDHDYCTRCLRQWES